ncbi:MAG: MmgE/PrpD family protein [Thermoleophilia bacterium]|nr:MmgE/PrpD family protein [Thermoleophilia bacterium]
MKTEQQLAAFVCGTSYHDLPPEVVGIAKDQILAAVGGVIAGAWAAGCETVAAMAKEAGGNPEASILVHGGKVPAQQAAFVNGVMARALDICDSAAPGPHPGSAIIPAALAAAELVGGVSDADSVSGADYLAAVCIGTEVALRFNLGEAEYDGFDPTGVCVPFGSAAAVAKILGLAEPEVLNALALAFCRCGASFQAHVDGSLAVRVVQGWVAETGVVSARLAARGITGPVNFLEGVYGYPHLFGRDRLDAASIVSGLGTDYQAGKLVFKRFPSCGATQAGTQLALDMMAAEGLDAGDVEHIKITVPPYVYRLVGHPFQIGDNPKVNAQFSIRYCVANALIRKAPLLAHFEEAAIRDPEVLRLVERIEVVGDTALDARGHTAVDMRLRTKDSREFTGSRDVAPGFPQSPLTREEHLSRFRDCVEFAARPAVAEKADAVIAMISRLDEARDIGDLVQLLVE